MAFVRVLLLIFVLSQLNADCNAFTTREENAMNSFCNIDDTRSRARHPKGNLVEVDCDKYVDPNMVSCRDVCREVNGEERGHGCYNSWKLVIDDAYRNHYNYKFAKSDLRATPRGCTEKMCRSVYVTEREAPFGRLSVDTAKWCCCRGEGEDGGDGGGGCTGSETSAHPTDCGKFLMCSGGAWSEFSCPSGLHFDVANGYCNFPGAANCAVGGR